VSGTTPLGNGYDGIYVNFNTVGRPSGETLIGGPDPGAGNVIAFNAYSGVDIRNSTLPNATDGSIEGNSIFSNAVNGIDISTASARDPHYPITRNSIYSNGHLGIDLGDDGITPNDSRGHIVGPNHFQNFPLITSVLVSGTATDVSGTLQSTPNSSFRIEFFSSAGPDPSGHVEGQTFLGVATVTTDASGHASFDHVVLPSPPAGQSLVTATATDGAGNTSEFSSEVQAPPSQLNADLSISVTGSPNPVDPGGILTYTITVTNNGPDAAANAAFTTAVPDFTTFQSLTAPPGWTTSTPAVGDAASVSASIASLNSGESAVFSLVVHVDDDAPGRGALTSYASVASDTNDTDASNNSATAVSAISPQPEADDLVISATADPGMVDPGGTVTFTITVTNNGPDAAVNAALSTAVPDFTQFRSLTAPDGWTASTPAVGDVGDVSASIASLGSGESAVFSFVVWVRNDAPARGTLTANASVASDTNDTDATNNSATAVKTTTPRPDQCDLAIAVSPAPQSVAQGGLLTFTVTVVNNSAVAATNVGLNFNMPDATTFEAFTTPGGWTTQAPAVGTSGIIEAWTGQVDPGASIVFTIAVRVDATASVGSTITCSASVVSESIDANQADNTAQASATVAPPLTADVTVGISADANPATVGQAVTYTIVVSNVGEGDSTGTAVHVTFPTSATNIAVVGASQTSVGLDLDVGTLAAGAVRTFRIVVVPLNTEPITVTAAATADPDVLLGGPASLTTTVVAAPVVVGSPTGSEAPPPPHTPASAPLVLSALRYGRHHQPTVLVVTFSKNMAADRASTTANYSVLVSAKRPHRAVPIRRVYFNPETREATLRVSKKVCIHRQWLLLVRDSITNPTGGTSDAAANGVAGPNFLAKMSLLTWRGPARLAPGARQVGIGSARPNALGGSSTAATSTLPATMR
jgi:uncharacterized repeat protein (TIGR01451 family)